MPKLFLNFCVRLINLISSHTQLEERKYYASINITQNHPHPPGQTSGTRLEGAKALLPGQSLCTKPSPWDKTGSQKAPPSGHKVRKFHGCIYKL